MNSMNVSDKITQLFKGLEMLHKENIFPYSSFKNDVFYFITREGSILCLLTAWLKYINQNVITVVLLCKDKDSADSPLYLQIKSNGNLLKWTIEERANGTYYLTERKLPKDEEDTVYETVDSFYFPYEFESFSIEYPQLVLASKADASHEDKIQAIAESIALYDVMYVGMDHESYKGSEHLAKPYIGFTMGTYCMFIAMEFDALGENYYDGISWSFSEPFFAKISMEDFEDILSLSETDQQFMLAVTFTSCKVGIPARDVYKAILRNKLALANLDQEKLSQVKEEERKNAQLEKEKKQKALKKKIKTITATTAAAAVFITVCISLHLALRTPFVSLDNQTSSYKSSYGQIDIYRSNKKDVVINEKSRVKSKISKAPEIIGPRTFSGKEIISFTSTAFIKYIDDHAFSGCQNLKTISLNQGVREIQSAAFENCPVDEIEIPNTVYLLGDDILAGSKVKKITVGKNVFEKYPDAFRSQAGRDDVEFIFTDDSAAFDPITYVTFSDDHKAVIDIFSPFETIKIPEGVESMSMQHVENPFLSEKFSNLSFWNERSCIKEFILPKSLKKIAEGSFKFSKIEKIELPENLEVIESFAFEFSSIKEIILNEKLKKIGSSCFQFSSIESIRIPDSVTEVENDAFRWCKNLKSVVIGNKLERISSFTFSGCSSLADVKLGKNIKCISTDAFGDCKNLEKIELNEGLELIGNFAFYGTNIKTVVIPKSVKEIKYKAFPYYLEKAYILNPDCIIDEAFGKNTEVIYIKNVSEIKNKV